MSYRQHVLSTYPQVYVDFADDPLANLANEGGRGTVNSGSTSNLTLQSGPAITDTQQGVVGAISVDFPVHRTFRSQEFTISTWVNRVSGTAVEGFMSLLTSGKANRLLLQSDRANRTTEDGYRIGHASSSGSTSFVGDIGFPSGGWQHMVIRRTMQTSTNGTIEVYKNGDLVWSYGSHAAGGTLGANTSGTDYVRFESSASLHHVAEAAFWARALSVEEIRSMSVEYAPQQWYVLESGIEVPVTLQGQKYTTSLDTPIHAASGVETTSLARTNDDAVTVSMWVKKPTGTLATFHGLFGHQAGTALATSHHAIVNFTTATPANHLYIGGAYNSGTFDRSIFDDGNYHHILYTAKARQFKFYVDGNLMTQGEIGSSVSLDTLNVGLTNSGANTYPWNGPIADFALWDTEFDSGLSSTLYGLGINGDKSSPIIGVSPLTGPTVYVEPPARYWDINGLLTGIDDATTIVEMVSVTDSMEDAYDVKLSALVTGGSKSGFTSDPVDIENPVTKTAFKALVTGLAKYPQGFIRSASMVNGVTLAYNLTSSSGVGIGGVAFMDDGVAWVNTTDGGRYAGTVFRTPEGIFHHELAHLLTQSFSEIESMESAWVGLTGPYIGSAYEDLPVGVRPEGFVRDYGKHSFREDFADVVKALMTTELYVDLIEWVKTDAALAEKVRQVKAFFASRSVEMSSALYYDKIHEGET